MNRSPLSLLGGIGLAALTATAPAQIVNGGFETGDFTGWTNSGNVAVAPVDAYKGIGLTGTYPYGDDFAAFNGGDQSPTGSITQTFATTAGTAYTLSFNFGNFGASVPQLLTASVSDATSLAVLGTSTVLDDSGSTDAATLLNSYTLNFTAIDTATRVTFFDQGSLTFSSDGILDNVSVTQAVPEPATLAALGMGAVALLRRRKRA